MNGFRGDLDKLTSHAGELGDLAGEAKRIADDLRHAVESAGACWGNDEIGARFAQSHQKPAEDALAALHELPAHLTAMSTKFTETAATYRKVDQSHAGDLGRVPGLG